jgi:hypothetical protein
MIIPKLTLGTLGLLATVCLPISASATTLTEAVTIPAFQLMFSSSSAVDLPTNPFQQFDASLGTLNSVAFSISGSADWVVPNEVSPNPISGQLYSPTPPGAFAISNDQSFSTNVTTVITDGSASTTISINLNGSVLPSSPFFSYLEGTNTAAVLLQFSGDQSFAIASANGLSGSVTYDYTAAPLPAALPLFATGIGGLGLLGWRRKPKTQAVAA